MSFTLDDFSNLTYVVFFAYIFMDTKIYLALWAAIYHLIGVASKAIFVGNAMLYKAIIATYIVFVLAGYLYKFRGILLSNEKTYNGEQWEKISSDKKKTAQNWNRISSFINS